ncbi:MAG TPA: pyridoxamine 5'-phosphate oxidase family protein [Gemmatimonadaceae bacterium]|nr:pyridoxamine 5'-phosphate oxidase family protein [Gemmatimonadaceae bacterium]
MTGAPVIRKLSREECDALLARNHIGRIAFSYRDKVDIEPLSYVFVNGWIYGRTSPGSKLRTLAHNRWVAFETDEMRGMFDWDSVIVKGALYRLYEKGAQPEIYAAAVLALRTIMPLALGAGDPMPERREIFRIHADRVTGRSARPGE